MQEASIARDSQNSNKKPPDEFFIPELDTHLGSSAVTVSR